MTKASVTGEMGLGDRMKLYEGQETKRKFLPLLPVIARIDGRAFHTFCRDLEKPYDDYMVNLMKDVTKFLVEETNANIGYTQSDEINLAWYSDDIKTQIFFDGKIFKMTSLLASLATAKFNEAKSQYATLREKGLATFDARVWQVPNLTEAANVFVWREQDATRNSIQLAGQENFSHKKLQGKSCNEIQEMLWKEKGINWNDYPDYFKRGTYFQRTTKLTKFSTEELSRLPAKHEARTNPDLEIERSVVEILKMPPITKILDKCLTLFYGYKPHVKGGE